MRERFKNETTIRDHLKELFNVLIKPVVKHNTDSKLTTFKIPADLAENFLARKRTPIWTLCVLLIIIIIVINLLHISNVNIRTSIAV